MFFAKVLNIWRSKRRFKIDLLFITSISISISIGYTYKMLVYTIAKGKPIILGRFIIELHTKDLDLLY